MVYYNNDYLGIGTRNTRNFNEITIPMQLFGDNSLIESWIFNHLAWFDDRMKLYSNQIL